MSSYFYLSLKYLYESGVNRIWLFSSSHFRNYGLVKFFFIKVWNRRDKTRIVLILFIKKGILSLYFNGEIIYLVNSTRKGNIGQRLSILFFNSIVIPFAYFFTFIRWTVICSNDIRALNRESIALRTQLSLIAYIFLKHIWFVQQNRTDRKKQREAIVRFKASVTRFSANDRLLFWLDEKPDWFVGLRCTVLR